MLPKYTTILVATDLTPNSENAFKHAVVLAREHGAKIHLLHVIPEVDTTFKTYVSAVMGEGRLGEFERAHEEDAKEKIRREVDQFAHTELQDHPEDLKRFAGTTVVHGHTVPTILRVADELDADVIVMGTHGKGALEYTFLGSTTEKILRKSKRPVFAVPLPN